MAKRQANADADAPSIQLNVIKADGPNTSTDAIKSNALLVEDEFSQFYGSGRGVLRPPYDPVMLARWAQQNNALGPCIAAMEQNVPGTGFKIQVREGLDQTTEDDAAIERIKSFFDEPWPGTSWTRVRRMLRHDLEATGNAYMEVLPNMEGQLVFVRYVQSRTMRMVKLDEPVVASLDIVRNGEKFTASVMVRERRFCQVVATRLVYFREYGATRELDSEKGMWESADNPVPVERRATSIIHFTVDLDVDTPYGVPRWITQTPSVIGSRKAEEANLSFFDNGGVPPVMIFVQGGVLAKHSAEALTAHVNSRGVNKHTPLVMELYGTGGDLNKGGQVKVTVERFGAERASDSMFENYDAKCFARIQGAYRLPSIFLGRSADYNFATAYTSYMVAEAQVFAPERDEEDDIYNRTIMRALDDTGRYVHKSQPLTVRDVTQQLGALTIAKNAQVISGEELVRNLNEVVGLELEYSDPPDPLIDTAGNPVNDNQPIDGAGMDGQDAIDGAKQVKKIEDDGRPLRRTPIDQRDLAKMAKDAADAIANGLDDEGAMDTFLKVTMRVATLPKRLKAEFNTMLAMYRHADASHDLAGVAELAGCTAEILAAGANGQAAH